MYLTVRRILTAARAIMKVPTAGTRDLVVFRPRHAARHLRVNPRPLRRLFGHDVSIATRRVAGGAWTSPPEAGCQFHASMMRRSGPGVCVIADTKDEMFMMRG
jgi:hypothetical protein